MGAYSQQFLVHCDQGQQHQVPSASDEQDAVLSGVWSAVSEVQRHERAPFQLVNPSAALSEST